MDNHLLAMGYIIPRLTRVPLLTAHHRAQRLVWERVRRHWTLEMWKNVTWADESRFALVHADNRVQVRHKPHEWMRLARRVLCKLSFSSGGLLTWAEMGLVVRVTLSVTCQRYRNMLDDQYAHLFVCNIPLET